jgi:hypothetical protein
LADAGAIPMSPGVRLVPALADAGAMAPRDEGALVPKSAVGPGLFPVQIRAEGGLFPVQIRAEGGLFPVQIRAEGGLFPVHSLIRAEAGALDENSPPAAARGLGSQKAEGLKWPIRGFCFEGSQKAEGLKWPIRGFCFEGSQKAEGPKWPI